MDSTAIHIRLIFRRTLRRRRRSGWGLRPRRWAGACRQMPVSSRLVPVEIGRPDPKLWVALAAPVKDPSAGRSLGVQGGEDEHAVRSARCRGGTWCHINTYASEVVLEWRQPQFLQRRIGEIFRPQLAIPTWIEQVSGDLKSRLRWIDSIGLCPRCLSALTAEPIPHPRSSTCAPRGMSMSAK